MTAKKLFYCYISGAKQYVHGSNAGQAATSLGHKLGQTIKPEWMKEVKPMYVYTFARKTSPYDKTSYEEVLAKSEKQAWYYFLQSRGKQYFAAVESIRQATKEDLGRLKEGDILDVTW